MAITAADVADAARLIAPAAVRTPLIENAALNDLCGRRVLVKFEGAQHSGSFKFRGAYNRLARLNAAERAAGVVAWSSGNHAQGVAFAARLLGIPATIVMPADAPAIKTANTRALGAEVVPYDRFTQSREAIATALATERGATLVPSFDDPFIIAGQGTIGLEILDQAQAAGADLAQILVCCGGGGLVAGTATAVKAARPDISIGADIIAGFPTEDEAMFANSLALVADCDIVHGHIFPYSPRTGTPAARMPQLDRATIKARAALLRDACAAQRDAWLARLVGTRQSVLVERNGLSGHAENFAPVRFTTPQPPSTIVAARISGLENGALIAQEAQ